MAICYIVGGGDFKGSFTPLKYDIVIAADGGYDHLACKGIRCDVIVGDLDSIKKVPEDVEIKRFPKKKDETDMYLAYLEGVSRGFTSFVIFGGAGGHGDHTFANYCLLAYIAEHGGNCMLKCDTGEVYAIHNREITVLSRPNKRLSVFAFGGDAAGVSISGAEYECSDITLTASVALGVSNSFVTDRVSVSVRDGTLLIMAEK